MNIKSTRTTLLTLPFVFLFVWNALRGPVPPRVAPTTGCAEVANPQYIWSRSDFKESPLGGTLWGVTAPKEDHPDACYADTPSAVIDAIEKSKHPFMVLAFHGAMDGDIHKMDIGGRMTNSAQFTNWDKPILTVSCMGDSRYGGSVYVAGLKRLKEVLTLMKSLGISAELGKEGHLLVVPMLGDLDFFLKKANEIWATRPPPS